VCSLRDGIEKYGENNWQSILDDAQFGPVVNFICISFHHRITFTYNFFFPLVERQICCQLEKQIQATQSDHCQERRLKEKKKKRKKKKIVAS
jgi:membrane-anchored glycerophosphoryl diester phosphodiesterase (GDPDase)